MSNPSNNNPLVSIFMITYNHEKYIAKALESILMQKVNFKYEIVVGEDCSTDNTREILLNYYKKYSDKFKLILHKQNVGAKNNQFITLKECKGKYIALLEGDDYWTDPDKLQKQVDFLEKNPDFAICFHPVGYQYEDPDQKRIFDEEDKVSDITYTEDLIKNNYIPSVSCVLRKDGIKEFPIWFKEVIPGDWPLFILASFGKKIFRLNEKMAVYRIHNNSNWSRRKYSYYYERMLNVLKYLEKDTPGIYLQHIKDRKYEINIELYKEYLIENNLIAALKTIPRVYSIKHRQKMKSYFAVTKIITVSFLRKFIKKRVFK